MNRVPIAFDDLAGWADDRHDQAFAAFRRGCATLLRGQGPDGAALRTVCAAAMALGHAPQPVVARRFFERHFVPHRLVVGSSDIGLVTGYFEPEIEASRQRTAQFSVPVLGPPEGLVALYGRADRQGLDPDLSHALASHGSLVELPERAEIELGALSATASKIAWLASPIDAFFLHVQGSGRLRFADGTSQRITYAGKNGHPYTSIGRLLVERGVMVREEVNMDSLRGLARRRSRAWNRADAREPLLHLLSRGRHR